MEPVRTWKSKSGTFSTEATFVSKLGNKVKLKKADGKVITVDADKLSEEDREWLDKRAKR